jgi:hypothetical protein
MDIGTIKNLLVWVEKKHLKPVRVNDCLLTENEVKQLIYILQQALTKCASINSQNR